jgi:hypothetical protein
MTTVVPISHFKSHCFEIIDTAMIHNQEIIITKRSHPIATVSPLHTSHKIAIQKANIANSRPKPTSLKKASIIGAWKGRIKIMGDIVETIGVEWDANK